MKMNMHLFSVLCWAQFRFYFVSFYPPILFPFIRFFISLLQSASTLVFFLLDLKVIFKEKFAKYPGVEIISEIIASSSMHEPSENLDS